MPKKWAEIGDSTKLDAARILDAAADRAERKGLAKRAFAYRTGEECSTRLLVEAAWEIWPNLEDHPGWSEDDRGALAYRVLAFHAPHPEGFWAPVEWWNDQPDLTAIDAAETMRRAATWIRDNIPVVVS